MAWVDCMRLRRVATIIRSIGWTVAGLIFTYAAVATFLSEAENALAVFGVLGAASVIVLAITYALAWIVDRRGDRLVTR
ncbi:MAG TPA: hypothetical protein VHP37_20650 [Burkholderiales bacterium]|nr:hypothetical protein [Burkholderiales bacterium]